MTSSSDFPKAPRPARVNPSSPPLLLLKSSHQATPWDDLRSLPETSVTALGRLQIDPDLHKEVLAKRDEYKAKIRQLKQELSRLSPLQDTHLPLPPPPLPESLPCQSLQDLRSQARSSSLYRDLHRHLVSLHEQSLAIAARLWCYNHAAQNFETSEPFVPGEDEVWYRGIVQTADTYRASLEAESASLSKTLPRLLHERILRGEEPDAG